MDLDQKKAHILRCVKLGMDLYSAALVAECTEEEYSAIEEDENFVRSVEIYGAIEERNILEKFNYAMEDELRQGKTNAIRWKLERINPRRWGTKEPNRSPRETKRVTIKLVGRYPDGS